LSALSIRPLHHDDLDRIFSRTSRRFGEEWLERQERSEMLVAVADLEGVPVGRANLDFVRRAAECIAFLWAAHVEPGYQSRGIGTTLFLHLEHVAQKRGFPVLQLAVGKENLRAFQLYQRLGYEVCGEEIDRWSYRDGESVIDVAEDCWTMQKRLAGRRL
jgi:ribosomal protein S18 acetylase RimI-like enzyme